MLAVQSNNPYRWKGGCIFFVISHCGKWWTVTHKDIHQIGCQLFRAQGAECRFPHSKGTESSPEDKTSTRCPGIVGWNMIWLMYQAFTEKYGVDIYSSFVCPGELNPLLFSQLCLFHYERIFKDYMLGVWSIYHQTDSGKSSMDTKLAHLANTKNPTILH